MTIVPVLGYTGTHMRMIWSRSWYSWSLLAILVVALGLRLWNLELNLWLDEYYTAAIADTIVKTGDTIFPTGFNYNRAWLYSYIVAGFVWMFQSNSEVVLRLPSVLFGLATLWLITDTTRLLTDKRFGLLAGLLTAVFPWAITYSQFARFYAPLIFFTALAMWASVRFQQMRGRGQWLWVGVAVGAAYLAGEMNLMGLAAGLFLFPVKWLRRFPWWQILGLMGVAGVALLGVGLWQFPDFFGVRREYTYAIWLGLWFLPWMAALSAGFWRSLWCKDESLSVYWMFFASLALMTLNQHANPQPRYLVFLLPAIMVGTVWVVYDWWQVGQKHIRTQWLQAGVVSMVAVLLLQQTPWLWQLVSRDYGSPVTGPNQISTSLDYFPDLKSPVLYVKEHAQPGDVIIAIKPRTETEYYLGKSPDYLLRSGAFDQNKNTYDDYLGVPLIESFNMNDPAFEGKYVYVIGSPSLNVELRHISQADQQIIYEYFVPVYTGEAPYAIVFGRQL